MIKLPINEMSSRYGTTRLSSGFTTSCCPNVEAKHALDHPSTRDLCEVRHNHVRHPDAATTYITACIVIRLSNLSTTTSREGRISMLPHMHTDDAALGAEGPCIV